MTRMTDVVLPPTFEQTASFTPGPWFYRTSGDGFVIRSKTAIGPIAGVNGFRPIGEAEANAHRIVTAVNAFDDMMASLIACQKALAMMTSPASIAASSIQHAWVTATAAEAKARAALSKAEGHIGQELAPGESAQ